MMEMTDNSIDEEEELKQAENDDDDYDNEGVVNNHKKMNPFDIESGGLQDVIDDDSISDDEEAVALLLPSNNSENSLRRQILRQRSSLSSSTSRNDIWNYHWLGEDNNEPWMIGRNNNILLLENAGIRLFKFVLVSTICIIIIHVYVWIVKDKRDITYGIKQMILYDMNHVVLDMIVFFTIGRLYEKPAVDSLQWTVPVLVTAIIQSIGATHLTKLQHSITPYEIHCEWTWQMWTLILLGCIPVLVGIVSCHVYESYKQGIGIRKLVEFSLSLLIFWIPYVGNQFLHLHHWYYGWLLGMHCNLHNWWSQLTMSILWGIYINGIAIFGRDPILTCAITLYQSQNQQCPYIVDYEQSNNMTYTLQDLAHDTGVDVLHDGCNNTDAL